MLIVNTASMCGFTSQYSGLQDLWESYRDRGLVVLGVPSDDFGGQELENAAEVKSFCTINYNIDFPMTDIVNVRGSAAHPYYKWVAEAYGGLAVPRWNFHKHLVDADGRLVEWFVSTTGPSSPKLLRAIEKILSLKHLNIIDHVRMAITGSQNAFQRTSSNSLAVPVFKIDRKPPNHLMRRTIR